GCAKIPQPRNPKSFIQGGSAEGRWRTNKKQTARCASGRGFHALRVGASRWGTKTMAKQKIDAGAVQFRHAPTAPPDRGRGNRTAGCRVRVVPYNRCST